MLPEDAKFNEILREKIAIGGREFITYCMQIFLENVAQWYTLESNDHCIVKAEVRKRNRKFSSKVDVDIF